jgi:Domain of unknown function (DUF397)
MHDYDLSRAQWKKSSYSGNSGNCVEVADLGGAVAVRDSKDPEGPVLVCSRGEWTNFLTRIKMQSSLLA